MDKKPEDETWFEFMARARKNGLSPSMQEEIDRRHSLDLKIVEKGEKGYD